jgi:hypothetical protein
MGRVKLTTRQALRKLVTVLDAVRPEIVRQHDRCNSDEEVTPYAEKLRLIDEALTAGRSLASDARKGE